MPPRLDGSAPRIILIEFACAAVPFSGHGQCPGPRQAPSAVLKVGHKATTDSMIISIEMQPLDNAQRQPLLSRMALVQGSFPGLIPLGDKT